MKPIFRKLILAAICSTAGITAANAQMVKMNGPATLAGCPNIGLEYQFSSHLSAAGDILWLPYMWDKHEEVFRTMQATGEVRYYFKEPDLTVSRMSEGWYLGGYAMYGNFNIGLYRHNDMDRSFRRMGWGVSAGVSGGWKKQLGRHWQMDINLAIGYAHLQYHKYKLGGKYKDKPIGTWRTDNWFGPTRFSVSFGYVIDCGCL